MLKWLYLPRLRRDADRWARKGLITPDQRDALLADARRAAGGVALADRLGLITGVFGAILVSAGILLFVGANWQEMPRLARFALLLAGMWGALAAAVWLARNAHRWLAEGAMLVGLSIYGGSIMLISQMYHIHGHYPDGVLIWALGALLAAWLVESQLALVMALALLFVWSMTEIIDFRLGEPHWPFFIPWAPAMALALWRKWRIGVHVAVLTGLVSLLMMLGMWLNQTWHLDEPQSALLIMLLMTIPFMAALMLLGSSSGRLALLGEALRWQGAVALIAVLFIMQMISAFAGKPWQDVQVPLIIRMAALLPLAMIAFAYSRRAIGSFDAMVAVAIVLWLAIAGPSASELPGGLWLSAAFVIGAALWLVWLAQREHLPEVEIIGLKAFAAEILYLYFVTLGSMLDTSLFMLAGGVLFIALAYVIFRIKRRGGRAAA